MLLGSQLTHQAAHGVEGIDGGVVEGFIKERVADELGGHAAGEEPLFFKREEAEDFVGEAAEFADAPGAPGPHLRGDHVDDFGATGAGELADGEVGGGGVDRDVDGDAVILEPLVDAAVDLAVLDDFLEAGDAHDGVVAGALDDGGAGAFHFGAAPGVDGEVGVAALEFGDDV